MDQINQKILELIRENARMSYSDIGKAVGISRVSAKKRMDSMEKADVIKGYHTVIDEEKTIGGLRYIIDIEAIPEEYAAVVKTLTADRELEQIYSTTGDCRIHCVGRSRNQSTMESHVTYLFNHTKGIRKISWHILLSDLRHAEEGDGYGTEKEKFQGV
ncbi:MAG: AsnC family transcriptional regulator [Lachnospiraceae bacterium]|nr:AsnC family transcriptional regulator [Lachnospiraceae bacterium]